MISNHVRYLPFFFAGQFSCPSNFLRPRRVLFKQLNLNLSNWPPTTSLQWNENRSSSPVAQYYHSLTSTWTRISYPRHTHPHTHAITQQPHLLTNYYYSNGYKPTRDYIIILNVLFKTSSPLQPHTSTYYTYSNINIYIYSYIHTSRFFLYYTRCMQMFITIMGISIYVKHAHAHARASVDT